MSQILKVLIYFSISAVIGITSLVAIIHFLSPYSFWITAIWLFYFTLFLTIFSSFTCAWIIIRFLFANTIDLKSFINSSARQASIVWILTCVVFFFLHKTYFSLLNLLILILIWIFIEIFYYWTKKI